MEKIDLTGYWGFCLDEKKEGIQKEYYKEEFNDTILLPGTVSTAQKRNIEDLTETEIINTGCLTDPYHFEGYTWYTRTLELTESDNREYFLILERTRISHVWIGEEYIGSNNSLCTSHRYRLTPYVKKQVKLTIMIDNTEYLVPGGHMTSPDTQTNWNGITGEIYIEECSSAYLSKARIYTDAANRLVRINVILNGAKRSKVGALVSDETESFLYREYILLEGENEIVYHMDEKARTWSEHTPHLYQLNLELIAEAIKITHDTDVSALNSNTANSKGSYNAEKYIFEFGLRDFKAAGHYFEINGSRTFLRGKHDGLIFPLTGHAPTDLKSWLEVLGTAKEYGINHYRFHTCCPPRACFEAADRLGIYLEPELPFWGTVTEEGEEKHDAPAQQYLIEEGFRILDEFGNHPSFAMMSLGNELWGSKQVINRILGQYKDYDNRHLYTQGSNNFQFAACILEKEDFYCGVRFSRDRLFRGSYAMCDAPLGHIQTIEPNTLYNYDSQIRPDQIFESKNADGEVTIQYGAGTKTVKTDAAAQIIPDIPVVSHEIGQYAMYPDYSEINKYTGVLKAKNLEVFKERLTAKGMLKAAESFFKASGRFAVQCYKEELETAFRSNELAGFQILDLQDFTGQGTALVGILNAFMENKGLITAKEWRQFCSDMVILAELPGFVYTAGEEVTVGIKLAVFRPEAVVQPSVWFTLSEGKEVLLTDKYIPEENYYPGVHKLCEYTIRMPEIKKPGKLILSIGIEGTDVENSYDLWVYPALNEIEEKECTAEEKNIEDAIPEPLITEDAAQAFESLAAGRRVVLYLNNLDDSNSIPGTYCTDFWCYPMFRSISESMGKPVPVGTHGLLIDTKHEIFKDFKTEQYTTPQWYDMIADSRALILDDSALEPIVWTIDNFERNHKLGNLFEAQVGEGRLFVCTFNLPMLGTSLPAVWLKRSIEKYAVSEDFAPEIKIEPEVLKNILKC